jgi:hypothetical protein
MDWSHLLPPHVENFQTKYGRTVLQRVERGGDLTPEGLFERTAPDLPLEPPTVTPHPKSSTLNPQAETLI